jgi:hypothetical protein
MSLVMGLGVGDQDNLVGEAGTYIGLSGWDGVAMYMTS